MTCAKAHHRHLTHTINERLAGQTNVMRGESRVENQASGWCHRDVLETTMIVTVDLGGGDSGLFPARAIQSH